MNSGNLDAHSSGFNAVAGLSLFSRRCNHEGEATVEVLINEEGKVFLPRIVSASEPAFGWAAVQAVAAWRFEPPTRNSAPVVTRVRIPFGFQIKTDEPAETTK